MKNFKKKYGDRVASVIFVVMLLMSLYPLAYWIENSDSTAMQVTIKFWYLIPITVVSLFVAYYFDNSENTHI